EPLTFSTLDRHCAAVFVGQKVLHRREQIRTQSPLFFAHSAQIPALQQECKKALRKILCFFSASTLSSHKAVNGPPINAAEFFKRRLCRRRFALCFQHHAPMRSSKSRPTVISVSANRGQRRHAVLGGGHMTMELRTRAEFKPVSHSDQISSLFRDLAFRTIAGAALEESDFEPVDDQGADAAGDDLMKVSGIRSPLESRVLHINDIGLHVVLAGPANGKPLIFLHGFPEFWFAWRGQIDHFVSLGYRVIIPDQRGYNLSEKPAGVASYSIDLFAKDVVGVLDAVAGSKAFVVGHDWGAAVTWYLAAKYSDRFRRAAMLSVPHPRVFIRNIIMNPAQLRKSCYIFLFQLPWVPEIILRRREWAL